MSARILLVTPGDAFASFAREAFDHWRLTYRESSAAELGDQLADASVVVLSDPVTFRGDAIARLGEWVAAGGVLLAMGGPGQSALAELGGVGDGGRVVEGWVRIDADRSWSERFDVELHAFGGCALLPGEDAEVLASWRDGAAAVSARRVGAGQVIVIGVDVWQSVGRILQGWPISGPGHPATDGSAPVGADGVLRCDDGLALSFTEDRAMPDGSPTAGSHIATSPPSELVPVFHRPHADLWRELVLHLILDSAEESGTALGWLHYWPAGVEAVGHVSHDADNNQDAHARLALDAFARAQVHATWCHVWPGGYSPEIVAEIGAAGHEQALHYNALDVVDGMPWGEEGFREQKRWADELTGKQVVSNKNHYTRWEGWTEFFGWCERAGITTDESRGNSKAGTVGFPYGTSHVWFPVGEDGHRYDVVEIPLHTQDVGWQSDESVIDVIAEQALSQHGVAHFLFHGANMARAERVIDAVIAVGEGLRARHMPAWTAGQIGEFERARRGVLIDVIPDGEGYEVRLTSAAPLTGVGVELQLPGDQPWRLAEDGEQASLAVVHRHGRPVIELAVDLNEGTRILRLAPAAVASVAS